MSGRCEGREVGPVGIGRSSSRSRPVGQGTAGPYGIASADGPTGRASPGVAGRARRGVQLVDHRRPRCGSVGRRMLSRALARACTRFCALLRAMAGFIVGWMKVGQAVVVSGAHMVDSVGAGERHRWQMS